MKILIAEHQCKQSYSAMHYIKKPVMMTGTRADMRNGVIGIFIFVPFLIFY